MRNRAVRKKCRKKKKRGGGGVRPSSSRHPAKVKIGKEGRGPRPRLIFFFLSFRKSYKGKKRPSDLRG